MKRLLAICFAACALALGSAHAEDKPAAAATSAVMEKVAEAAPAAPAAVAPAAVASSATAAPAAAPAPVPNKGDTAWMIVATVLVILMTIPGLAMFYGGLVRSKNMLSVLMQVFVVFSLCVVLWAIYGYSVAFTEGSAYFGGFSKALLKGITPDSVAATFSKGVVIPELIYVVWYWAGPDAYTDAKAAEAAAATAGFLFQKGALDFAGGTVVHINAGIAGLIGAILIGKRVGYGRESFAPHSLTTTMIGASLVWVGWFGFNVGSNLEANGLAGLVFANTLFATAAAAISWLSAEWVLKGKPSMLGAASGAVAGLVAITPACGFVGVGGALIIGLLAGVVCLWGVTGLKRLIGADDALDVFGVHGIGGILGAILTGVFVSPSLGGTGVYDYVANKVGDFDMTAQLISQLWGVGTAIVWSAVVSLIAYKIVDLLIGLRVPEDEEREGLDVTSHGESAYHL